MFVTKKVIRSEIFFNKFEFADTESKSHYDIDLEPVGFFSRYT